MKKFFVNDVDKTEEGKQIELLGWLRSKNDLGNVFFLDIEDSTGVVQAVIGKDDDELISKVKDIAPESSVKIIGNVITNQKGVKEVKVNNVELIGPATLQINPQPRKNFNIFDSKHADNVLKNRPYYLRNDKLSSVIKFKSKFIFETHKWFQDRGFVFIDAPVLTKLLLYDDSSAFELDYSDKVNGGQKVFLSQCNTFQLEAAIHKFEKVYNLTPSFRAEHSKSNRHLREYWHLKTEIAWANLDDLIKTCEQLLYEVSKNTFDRSKRELEILEVKPDLEILKPPYKRISYDEMVEIIHSKGAEFEWGKSLGINDEKIITEEFGNKPLWIDGIPCSAEAFPFARSKENPKITRTCDLITPFGFGEIMGTAEKICDKKMLLERMAEKNKTTPRQLQRYQWYIDMRDYGCVPHGGIGAGVERIIRFLLRVPHVRDTISFPRLYGRYPNP